MISERCSCGAGIELPAADPKGYTAWNSVMEALSIWRRTHRHEFAPAEPETPEHPLIDETSSSHERAEQRFPLGFMPEPEEGWR